ncbi:hypothetical protein AtDm6_1628 [Acetobacter tropicalis]|uniref:Uncharacterized protein n=1 Tax=Acetobacter tropicalis TaxID=104102 RepID=A0A094ZM74_9PROT|nr:hypothetical protein AtDm6_1628 [Acetobacter tropicalis]
MKTLKGWSGESGNAGGGLVSQPDGFSSRAPKPVFSGHSSLVSPVG